MALTKVTGSVIKDSVSLSGNVSVGGTLTYQDVTNVDALGIGTFRTGIKVLAGQIDVGSNIKIGNAGVITATSFVGSGANLTSLPTQVTITGNADNRVITGGSGVNLNAESSLTFDGSKLVISNTSSTDANNSTDGAGFTSGTFHHRSRGDSAGISGQTYSNQLISSNGTNVALEMYTIGATGTPIVFGTNSTERLRIDTTGRLLLGQSSAYTVNPAGGTILGVFTRTQSNRSDFILSNQSSADNAGAALVLASHGQDYIIESTGSGNSSDGASSLTFSKSSTERFRLDSAGRFLKGLTSAGGSRSSTSVRYPHFQLSSPWSSGLGSYKIECTDDYPIIFIDSNAAYANNSGAGTITWSVKDSSGDYCNTASVLSKIDGTPSNDSAPGRLEFMTTTSGASPTTKMTISSEGYVTKPNQPYFKANLANGVRITGTGYVVFGSAVYNNGSHYNTSDGKFTAPVTGLYWFSSRINAYDRIDFQIRVNGNEVERGQYNTDNDDVGWWSNQMTTITYMTAGQYAQVYVTVLEQNTDPGNWCSFMGYLIG